MRRLLAIAVNTFRETIRDRILVVIILFALAMIVASLWLASISLGEQGRMIEDFGLVAVTFFSLVVAVFVSASLVRKEVEKRTVFVIFSKPVTRGEFIWGKSVGFGMTMFVVTGGMGLFLFLLDWAVARSPSGWLLVASLLIYLQVLVVMEITLLFSTVTSATLASVLGICVYAAGQLSSHVLSLTRLGQTAMLKWVSKVIFYAIPNFGAIDLRGAVLGEGAAKPWTIVAWSGYMIAYGVVTLLLATWIFRRKEF